MRFNKYLFIEVGSLHKLYLFPFIMYIASLMFYGSNNVIVFLVSLLVYSLIAYFSESILHFLIESIIYSIPTSFLNILNGSYGLLPISWFNIFYLLLLLYIINDFLKNRKRLLSRSLLNRKVITSSIILTILLLVSLFSSKLMNDALKQFLNMLLVLISFPLGFISGKMVKDEYINKTILVYSFTTLLSSIVVIIQFLIFHNFGLKLGNIAIYGSNRIAFGISFTDFSFLSLYLTSGLAGLMTIYNKFNINLLIRVFWFTLIFVASLITSARTGIVAFVLILVFHVITSIYNKTDKKLSIMIKYISLIVAITLIFALMIYTVRPTEFLNDSGRMKLNIQAWNVFLENPLFGFGLGTNTYFVNYSTLPHNLVFQLLAQGGLILTIPLLSWLFYLLYKSITARYVTRYMYLLILVGSMFIPDIFNSRMLSVIILISSMSIGFYEEKFS